MPWLLVAALVLAYLSGAATVVGIGLWMTAKDADDNYDDPYADEGAPFQ